MGSRPPADLGALIVAVSEALGRAALPHMLIGGQAVLVHGRPRLTEDIDITLDCGPERLPDLLTVCADVPLTPLPPDPPAFARDTFVLPARHAASGVRVDFIFSTTPYEHQAIARAVPTAIASGSVPIATAEDLLLHKLFAGRPVDIEDAAAVVRRRGRELDWAYLERWAAEFAGVPGREGLADQVRRLKGPMKT